MGIQLGECQQRGYPAGEVLEEVESHFDELDCLRGGPLLDGEGLTREPIVVLDWIGDALPLSFSTRSSGGRDAPLTLPLPPPMTGPPQCWSKRVACIVIAGPVGIGQMKHPQRVVMSR